MLELFSETDVNEVSQYGLLAVGAMTVLGVAFAFVFIFRRTMKEGGWADQVVEGFHRLVDSLIANNEKHEKHAAEQVKVSQTNSETLVTQTQLMAAVAGTVKDHDDKVDKRIEQILDAVKGSCKAGMSADDSVVIPSQPKPKK